MTLPSSGAAIGNRSFRVARDTDGARSHTSSDGTFRDGGPKSLYDNAVFCPENIRWRAAISNSPDPRLRYVADELGVRVGRRRRIGV